MNTVDAVRECQVQVGGDIDQHRVRVGRVIGVRDVSTVRGRRVEEARELGCSLFVGKRLVFKRFKYHAGLRGSYVKQGGLPVGVGVGLFVTLFVTTAILGALAVLGASWAVWFSVGGAVLVALTTKSLDPRPGKVSVVDYVGDIPEAVLDNIEKLPKGSNLTVHSMYPLPTKEYFKQVDPVMIWWLDDEIGAVVGVWDNDKEMEL